MNVNFLNNYNCFSRMIHLNWVIKALPKCFAMLWIQISCANNVMKKRKKNMKLFFHKFHTMIKIYHKMKENIIIRMKV